MEGREISYQAVALGPGVAGGAAVGFYGGAGAGVEMGNKHRFSPPSPSPSPSPTPSPPGASAVPAMAPAAVAEPLHAAAAVMGPLGMGMIGGDGGGGELDYLARKKRGRPRKYGPDGTPVSPPSPFSSDLSGRRVRGRPRGSGERQVIAALGGWYASSAGGNFTPHVITIAAGEDVAARIFSFSRKGPRAVCILSANGSIANVTLRQPGTSGGTLTYEGRFEILSLTGSFTVVDNGGGRSRAGGISVSLASPDGRVVGGGVAGSLLAASPIQLVVGSFLPNCLKEQRKSKTAVEAPNLSPNPTSATAAAAAGIPTEARPISQASPCEAGDEDDDDGSHKSALTSSAPPSAAQPGQSGGDFRHPAAVSTTTAIGPRIQVGAGGWQGLPEHPPSEPCVVRPSPDINICLAGGE